MTTKTLHNIQYIGGPLDGGYRLLDASADGGVCSHITESGCKYLYQVDFHACRAQFIDFLDLAEVAWLEGGR